MRYGALTFLLLFGFQAFAEVLPKLPIIQQVGVIPVKWEGDHERVPQSIKDRIAAQFPEAVRDSKRFRVLNDDLVEQQWSSVDGRADLKTQFELDAFVGINVALEFDTIRIQARILSPQLSTYILETESVKDNWLEKATTDDSRSKLENIVFRLFNRIPVDVSITSVQGAYVTLSGGKEQGIEVSDQVQLVRTKIKSVHPANRAWLAFSSMNLGEAKVIEVKTHTSVAKIVAQTYEGAVEVGDGARIDAISSRTKFARLSKKEEFRKSTEPNTIVVPPLYQGTPEGEQAQGTDKSGRKGARPSPFVEKLKSEEKTPWDDFTGNDFTGKPVDTVTVLFGIHGWSMNSMNNTHAFGNYTPIYVNTAGVDAERLLSPNVGVALGGTFAMGNANDGNYNYLRLSSRGFYTEETYWLDGLVNRWKVGAMGDFATKGVYNNKYGGGDFLRFGVYGEANGVFMSGMLQNRFDWYGRVGLVPLNFGNHGQQGKERDIQSTIRWEWTAGGYMHADPGEYQWGLQTYYATEYMTLETNSSGENRSPHLQESSITALMRLDFN